MALPKIDSALFEMELPSNSVKIKYRQFNVKEEKILLLAQETKDIEQVILAIKQVIGNCVQDYDVDKLATVDLEYLLLILRSKSVDNNVSFSIRDPDTKETVKLEIDINDVKIMRNELHSDMISVNEEYIIKMRYPTINEFLDLTRGGIKNSSTSYNIMVSCMEQLLSKDEVYNFSDFSKEEIDKFVDDLNSDVIAKLKKFFETMPKLRHEVKYKNNQGTEKTFVIEGIETFFT